MSGVIPVDDRFERLADALEDQGERHALESLLPAYLRTQRWFGGQARGVTAAIFAGWLDLGLETDAAVCLVDVTDEAGLTTRHQLYLGISSSDDVPAVVDAIEKPEVRDLLAEVALHGVRLEGRGLSLAGIPTGVDGVSLHGLESRVVEGEQSNTSLVFGSSGILKIYRRLEGGPHPELELLTALSAGDFGAVPQLWGSGQIRDAEGFEAAALMLQAFVPNEGDGWAWGVECARRALEACSSRREVPGWLEAEEGTLQGAAELGRVTAQMHAVLAQATGPDMAPEPMSASHVEALAEAARREAAATGELLRATGHAHDDALAVLDAAARVPSPLAEKPGLRIRIHGDYHLGQVLRRAAGFVITDFEGEPARSLAERRQRQPALMDVAGMVRSFAYAGQAGLRGMEEPGGREELGWAWTEALAQAFLEAYWREAAHAPVAFLPEEPDRSTLLRLLELRKALYELRYELNNRPDWAAIPLASIIRLGATRD
jgi:trehalose synthase-fused probable maltokinase